MTEKDLEKKRIQERKERTMKEAEELVSQEIEKDDKKGISFFVEIVKIFFLALLIIIPVRTFIFQPFFVQGASMEPNYHDGEYLIVNELGYKKTVVAAGDKTLISVNPFKDLQRGDVVVFRYPANPNQFFIKRIVALPGERIVIKDGKVRIFNEDYPNGFYLDESEYIPTIVSTNGNHDQKMAAGEYYVLGDNRMHSSDSRNWGVLSEDMIIGKVLLRAWPIGEFEIF